jgi:hypothetical protein
LSPFLISIILQFEHDIRNGKKLFRDPEIFGYKVDPSAAKTNNFFGVFTLKTGTGELAGNKVFFFVFFS